MPSEDAVDAAFRWILGRPPESPAARAHHAGLADEAALRRTLLTSPEFQANLRALTNCSGDTQPGGQTGSVMGSTAGSTAGSTVGSTAGESGGGNAGGSPANRPGTGLRAGLTRYWRPDPTPALPQTETETETDRAETAALFESIARVWTALGQAEPHFSVLTHRGFRADRIEAYRADFEASADEDLWLIEDALTRLPDLEPATNACLELGAGVGRVTRRLATRFAEVHAVDVSASHLGLGDAE
ncbi:MAG: hypothetical protein AAFR52_16670, partial [Pseudomonadota bacterium]